MTRGKLVSEIAADLTKGFRQMGKSFEEIAKAMPVPKSSGYRTLEQSRKLRSSHHFMSGSVDIAANEMKAMKEQIMQKYEAQAAMNIPMPIGIDPAVMSIAGPLAQLDREVDSVCAIVRGDWWPPDPF